MSVASLTFPDEAKRGTICTWREVPFGFERTNIKMWRHHCHLCTNEGWTLSLSLSLPLIVNPLMGGADGGIGSVTNFLPRCSVVVSLTLTLVRNSHKLCFTLSFI